MFRAEVLLPKYKKLIGWRPHHDTTEIDIVASLSETESGEYYKHPALRLDIVKATLPENRELDEYLETTEQDAIVEIFNDLLQYRQVKDYGKTLLKQSQLLNRYGFLNDKIVNENRFVGFQIRLHTASGIQAVINQIGLQFATVETFDLYLFHTSKTEPLKVIEVTTTGNAQWDWKTTELLMSAFELDEYNGGAFVLGYYQDELIGNAINNTDFDWDKGACPSCNGGNYDVWRNIAEYFTVYPLYVPNGSFEKGEMFDMNNAFFIKNESYGLNLRMTTRCDLTSFFIENRFVFKNLLKLKVTLTVLNDMKFSQQINYIEENIKMMIIRDLEGDKETNATNVVSQYQRELKAVNFNIGGINEKCLPCEGSAYEPDYGVV